MHNKTRVKTVLRLSRYFLLLVENKTGVAARFRGSRARVIVVVALFDGRSRFAIAVCETGAVFASYLFSNSLHNAQFRWKHYISAEERAITVDRSNY